MKTKSILKEAREKYLENDIETAVLNLASAYSLGSDIAAKSLLNILEMNIDNSNSLSPKIQTFKLLMPVEQTKVTLNSFLLFDTASSHYLTKLADSFYQGLVFPDKISELYRSGNVAGTLLKLQKSKDRLSKGELKTLNSLIKKGIVSKIEPYKNSYKLYKLSYEIQEDLYSLSAMAYMEEQGLGVEKNLASAFEKYQLVLIKGSKKLFGQNSNAQTGMRRQGFAEVVTATAGLTKVYLKQLIKKYK